MYVDFLEIISERLGGIGLPNVATAIGDQPPLPAAQPFLSEDKEITKETIVVRELTWIVKVTVGHNEANGQAEAQMMGLLDSIRNGFAGWRPDGLVGVQRSFSVPSVRISDFKDHGSLEYHVFLRLRVNPQSFKRNLTE